AKGRLQLELGQGLYDTWIEPLRLVEVARGTFKLRAPSRLVRDYVASHYAARIERALARSTNDFTDLEIVVPAHLACPLTHRSVAAQEPVVPSTQEVIFAKAEVSRASLHGLWDRQPDPAQSFSSYVVGASNEFAFKAAECFATGADADLNLL